MPTPIAAVLALVLAAAAAAAPTPSSTPSRQQGVSVPTTGVGAPVSGGTVRAPLSAEQMRTLDEALKRAEGIVLDVESMTRGDGTGCPASFSVREYMQDIRSKRHTRETGDDLLDTEDVPLKKAAGSKLDWENYYLCQALATRNPSACSEASSVTPKTLHPTTSYREGLQDPSAMPNQAALTMQASQNYESKCILDYHQMRARAAYISKAPNFMDICRESVPHLADLKDAASGEAICRAYRDYNGNPEPFIAALQAGVKNPFKREFALSVVREMTLAPGICASVSGADYQLICRESEDFKKAVASKNAGACRGGLCRVLMGQGAAACEAYASKFKEAACDQHYAAEFVEGSQADFKRYSDQVEGFLANSDAGLGDRKQLKAFNDRLDKLYDLRARLDKAADEAAPKPRSAAAGPRKKGA